MSMDWYQSVLDWHKLCAPGRIGTTPAVPTLAVKNLTMKLIRDESVELETARDNDDLAEIADAIGDRIFTELGMAVSYGIDMRPVMDAIITANMTKATGSV